MRELNKPADKRLLGRVRRLLGESMTAIVQEAFGRDDTPRRELAHKLQMAERKLVEAIGELLENTEKWTDEASNLSSTFMTFLRKADSTRAGSIIYHMVNRSRGLRAWRAYVTVFAEAIKNGQLFLDGKPNRYAQDVVETAERAADAMADFSQGDNFIMRCALMMWRKSAADAIEMHLEDLKADE